MHRRLIFAGKQMGDEKQAKDYNVEGGSVLHLVSLCLRAARHAFSRLHDCPAVNSAYVCLCHPLQTDGGAVMMQVLALRGGSQQ